MIKLLQSEYDAWAQILKENAEKRQALKQKLDETDDELLRSCGVDPEGDDLLIELPPEIIKQQTKLQNKYESELIRLDDELSELQSPIIQAGIDRAIRGKTLKAIYEDAKATIYSHAYDEMTEDGAIGAYALFGGAISGTVDLNVDDHILELRNKGEVALADDLLDLVDRYKAGEITRSEAEPYKGFEYIVIEVPLPKGKNLVETTEQVKVNAVAIVEQNVTANADLVSQIFNGRGDTSVTSILKITDDRGTKKAKTREAKVLASINYEGLTDVTIVNRQGYIGRFERLVFDAVISLYDAGNECMSVDMIANAMNGNKFKDSATEKQREDIVESLRKLCVTRVVVNTKAAAADYPDLEKITRESYLLNADFVSVEYRGGTWDTAIRVNKTPLLIQYANGINQVVRKDIKLLAAPVQANRENIVLRGYLYNRVINASSRSNYKTILVDTILEELDITQDKFKSRAAFAKKKRTITTNVVKILDYWKAEGFIKGYSTQTVKRGGADVIAKFILE